MPPLIIVQRQIITELSSIGDLSLGGSFFCYSLEPRKDQSKGKPYCIPAGIYPVKIGVSPKWSALKKYDFRVPILQNVPNFTMVEIHPGNYPGDTDACTLVGTSKGKDIVGNSDLAFFALFHRLPEEFEIEYRDVPLN